MKYLTSQLYVGKCIGVDYRILAQCQRYAYLQWGLEVTASCFWTTFFFLFFAVTGVFGTCWLLLASIKSNFSFQHAIDPKHTANWNKECIKEMKINVIKWPSQRSDLSPVKSCGLAQITACQFDWSWILLYDLQHWFFFCHRPKKMGHRKRILRSCVEIFESTRWEAHWQPS